MSKRIFFAGLLVLALSLPAALLLTLDPPVDADPLAVADAYLLAWDEEDFERLWELMSGPARELWAEVLEPGEPEKNSNLPDFRVLNERFHAAEFGNPRQLFLHAAPDIFESPSVRSRVKSETPEVVIDGDRATVTWPAAEREIHLGLEQAGWRVHQEVGVGGTFELTRSPGGRMVPVVVFTTLTCKDDADLETWWLRLPRLSGLGPEPTDADLPLDATFTTVRFFVDAGGRVRRFGREMALDDLPEFLFQRADCERDMEHPAQYSTVVTALHLDQDLPGKGFCDLLLLLTAPEVRMRSVYLAARYENTTEKIIEYDRGLSLDLAPVFLRTSIRIRVEETAMTLLVRDVGEAADGTDLAEALAARPEADRKKGIRVRFGPHVPTGRIMEVLHVLAQQENDLRIVLDLRAETVPETPSGLELDERPSRLPEIEGKVKTTLDLEVWR
jgi:hypothetical protein